ncbi:MAG: HD domain-containing protein [bacterium]|nr:HD domain-containing protein [bacterium]
MTLESSLPPRTEDGLTTREAGQEFIPLDANQLTPGKEYQFPIYLFHEGRNRYVLFKNENDSISSGQMESLTREGKRSVFIPKGNLQELNQALTENLAGLIDDPSVPIEAKTQRVHAVSRTVMQNLFDAPPDNKAFIQTSKHVSDSMAELMIREPASISQLATLRTYDYYTYTHSMNVCVLAVGLYSYMNPRETPDTIKDIARGMLLHDIGKCDVPTELTNKKGKLSDAEWDVMKSHTVKGFHRLETDEQLTSDSRGVSLMHHEALDGSGYPDGRGASNIPFTSRLCKVVDVYDALTSRRSYKKGLKPFEALRLMTSEMKDKIDQNILREFILFMDQLSKANVRR